MTDLPAWSLDSDIRDALQELVSHSCEAALQAHGETTSAERLHVAAQSIYSAIQDSVQLFSHGLNDGLPINQLPREIFLAIVALLPFRGRVLATHVCQHWKTVCLGAPALWSSCKVYTSYDGSLGTAADILARSGSAPLSLDLTIFSSCDAVGALLRDSMIRLQSLVLRLDLEWVSGDAVGRTVPLKYALREPAPILRNLDLTIFRLPRDIETEISLPPDLLADAAPMLESAQFSGIALDIAQPYRALSAVRTLALDVPAVDFSALLALYPLVERLRVHARQYTASSAIRALKHLDIAGTVEAVDVLVSRLAQSPQSTICMDLVPADVFAAVVAHAPRDKLRELRLYMKFPSLLRAIELHCDAGCTWVLGIAAAVPEIQQTLLHADALRNLRDLTIHELLWPRDVPIIGAALHLARLELALGSFSSVREHYQAAQALEEHVGLFYDLSRSELMCPGLQEVCLSAPGDAPPLVLDVGDVWHFVNYRVRFVGLRLARLVLRNTVASALRHTCQRAYSAIGHGFISLPSWFLCQRA